MKLTTTILIVMLFLSFQQMKAQFPVDTTYETILVDNLPELPNVFESIEDVSVPENITLTRITEYNTDWGWYPIYAYAKIQPWNSDATMYKFYSVAIYNAETHQIIRELPGDLYPSYWSNINPDIMFSFREDGEIKTYSVANDSFQVLYQLQGYDLVKLGPGEGNIDKNDHYVALIGKNNTDMDIIIFDIQSSQVIHTQTFFGAWGNGADVPDYIDWVSVSQSGDYVGIMWNHNTTSENNPFNGHFGVEIYNTNNMEFLRRIAIYGNHGDFGYEANGEEVFVQFWGPSGTVNAYYLDRMEHFVVQDHLDFGGEGHISCRNLNRPGWAYVSIEEPSYGVMVAMKLDESGTVEYFGHHYSSSTTYCKSPMPVPTPNGDKIMFKTDFGNAGNAEEVFTFEAEVSEELNSNAFYKTNFIVYPNPATGIIEIKTDSLILEINIYNQYGQLVLLNSHKNSIDISRLNQGIYFAKIKSENGFFELKKIIKE